MRVSPAPSVDEALITAPSSIQGVLGVPRIAVGGAPMAVGRLRRRTAPPMLDCLTCALPKEDAQHAPMIGVICDALLVAWAEWLTSESNKSAFESLAASAGISTEAVLVSRGFRENDEVDFEALSRGAGLCTHTARLPSALLAATARVARPELTEYDREHAEALMEALRALDAPPMESDAQTAKAPKRDPWAAPIKGFGQ